VTVSADAEESDADAFGGHLMVAFGASGRFSGVQALRMGQRNVLGRYPFHFHNLDGALHAQLGSVQVADGADGSDAWARVTMTDDPSQSKYHFTVVDRTYMQSCLDAGDCATQLNEQTRALNFELDVPAAGTYQLLLARPPHNYKWQNFLDWSRNMSVLVTRPGELEVNPHYPNRPNMNLTRQPARSPLIALRSNNC
jgi:hypothetical protein